MKLRNGFVSNSSSSSFVIKKELLTDRQLYNIYNHIEIFRELLKASSQSLREIYLCFTDSDEWTISETDDEIRGSTILANFDMEVFFDMIDIPRNIVEWGE